MATIHIVVARANVSNPTGQFTNNMFVEKNSTAKRMRGGTRIASVKTTKTITATEGTASYIGKYKSNVCGLALYDIGSSKPTSAKNESILIKGVADVTLTEGNKTAIKNLNSIQILRQIGDNEYRCFFDFTKNRYNDDTVKRIDKIQPGLESTETHLAVTHEFDPITDVENYDVGIPTHFQVGSAIDTLGMMLWPLTEKATQPQKGKFHRAAVITQGVVTSFVDDTSEFTPLEPIYISCPNSFDSITFLVLEVYERSVKLAF